MRARILLVDNHQMVREGLRALLEKQPDWEVVGDAGDGPTALRLVRDLRPDLVLWDVNLQGINAIDATRLITRNYPRIKVLALSMNLRKAFVAEIFQSGASGYILKENAFAEVVKAIRTILAGERYVCLKTAGLFVDGCVQGPDRASEGPRLTERETEIIRLLANGKTSKEIALATRTSTKTVDAYRRRVLRKLGVASTAGIVKYAIREGLTVVDE